MIHARFDWVEQFFNSKEQLRDYLFKDEAFTEEERRSLSERMLALAEARYKEGDKINALEIASLVRRDALPVPLQKKRMELIDDLLYNVELSEIKHLRNWVHCRWKHLHARKEAELVITYPTGKLLLRRAVKRCIWEVFLDVKGVWVKKGEVNLHQLSVLTLDYRVHSEGDTHTIEILAKRPCTIKIRGKEVTIYGNHHSDS